MQTQQPVHSEFTARTLAEHPEYSQIVGVFEDSSQVTQAVEALKHSGFAEEAIQCSEYDPRPIEGEESALLEGIDRRFLVHVNMPGKEEEAVDILTHHGANNSDLPRGTVLIHGELMSAGAEGETAAGTESMASILKAEQEAADLRKTEAQHLL